ncbi:MAG: hypothetical protein IPK66_11900 [Rhodospirillales bacterium]|nr:hypothetical protein [Rhodospirillales bacterium]
MARRKHDSVSRKKTAEGAFVLFDVLYEDGSRSSNRKVPREEVDGLDGDEPARALIEEQDRKIAELSGRPRGPIKTIARSPNQ